MRQFLGAVLFSLALCGCAGSVSYVRPEARSLSANSITINKPFDQVWQAAVPELGKRFFVINNIEKASGFINLSYSGDPEKYLDCGQITSTVKNLRGERTYTIPGARGEATYEIMLNNQLLLINRQLALDGRVNLIFESVGPAATRVTANTKYVVNRNAVVTQFGTGQVAQRVSDSIGFGSGGVATFPSADGNGTTCTPNGVLEQEVLDAIVAR